MVDGSVTRTIADIMRRPALTAAPSDTLAAASASMREHNAGAVVVVDDTGRPIGIFTERDLIRCAAGGADPTTSPVAEWMTQEPQTVSSDEARSRPSSGSPIGASGTSPWWTTASWSAWPPCGAS